MVFNFRSAHTRLTRTSSDLRVLSAILLPPSPILEADSFPISSTSGEIPILLEATTHVGDSPLHIHGEPVGPCDVAEESKLVDKLGTARHTKVLTRRDEASLKNWMCAELDDMCTAEQLPNGSYRGTGSPIDYPARTVTCGPKNGPNYAYNDLFSDYVGLPSIPGDCSPSLRISGRQDNVKQLRDSQASHPNTMEFNATSVVLEEDLDGAAERLVFATFHTYSTLPTPIFAPPSPSPSADVMMPLSSPVGRQRHRRPLERARAVRFPGRPRSPRAQLNEAEANLLHNTPSPTNHTSYPQRQLTDPIPDTAHPFVKRVVLPEELSWMNHMAIELWIDQEGFRAVRPYMQLIGYSSRSRSLHPYESTENIVTNVTAGVAEFMPTKRETFAFHYAALDSPPTLRMVSVAGDESRDYISKQAALSVKVNGVYTVIGTETCVLSVLNRGAHGSRPQNAGLRWKFDYLVSDRKVDGARRTITGEKALTPLTFSCSPYLFHRSQGKKTGLIHIMKKNLAPKLASQKLEPPTYTSSRSIPSQGSRHLSPRRDAAAHVRSHSDASTAQSGGYPVTRSPVNTGAQRGEGRNHVPRPRRRRASSAGENSLARLRSEPTCDMAAWLDSALQRSCIS